MKLIPQLKQFDDLVLQFKDHLIELNQLNGLLQKQQLFIPLNELNYDHDLTKYQDVVICSNYFKNHWSFKDISSKVFSAKLDDPIYVPNRTKNSKAYKKFAAEYTKNFSTEPQIQDVLTWAVNQTDDPNVDLSDFDFDGLFNNDALKSDSHHFYFNSLKVLNIDNQTQQIIYHGTFEADSHSMELIKQDLAFVKLTLLCSKPCEQFYKEIMLDAYSQLLESNYKMAFFNAFAAFDNFVNTVSDKATEKDRLDNKFTLAYATKTYQVNGDTKNFAGTGSFSKLKNILNDLELEKIRNDIAHANQSALDWSTPEMKDLAIKMYIFSSAVMLCFHNGYKDFPEIRKYLKDTQLNRYSRTTEAV